MSNQQKWIIGGGYIHIECRAAAIEGRSCDIFVHIQGARELPTQARKVKASANKKDKK